MTRTSRSALVALTIAASFVGFLAIGAPARAADVTVPSVTIDPTTETFVVQTITTDVRGFNPVVQIAAPLDGRVFNLQMQGLAGALAADCDTGGPGVWNCLGDFEATGTITIRYLVQPTPPPPGRYTVSVSMGDNGVTYTGSGTVTVVGPANPPSSSAAAPNPPTSHTQAPATGGAPPAPGPDSPPSQAPSVGPTGVPTGPTTATTTSDPPELIGGPIKTSYAATVTTQRTGQSGPLATVVIFAGVVVAAGAAAGLVIWRRPRRSRGLPDA
jgi:hypothetical protein